MSKPLPISDAPWDQVSPDARAAIAAAVLAHAQRITELETQVHDLQARLGNNSTNSPEPPSPDPIGTKRKPPAPPGGRRRGGQPGHDLDLLELATPEEVRSATDCKPTACRRGHHELTGDDPKPLIHQVAERPKLEPIVGEDRVYRLACPRCGELTCGVVPARVPAGCFGPHLQAALATLAGACRLCRRQIPQDGRGHFGHPDTRVPSGVADVASGGSSPPPVSSEPASGSLRRRWFDRPEDARSTT